MQIATSSLVEPSPANSITSAITWVEGTLLGSIAISTAVIAVAVVGFLLLSGRMDVRRGASVVLGAFILFGSAQIAMALDGLADSPGAIAKPTMTESQARLPAPSEPVRPYDPYAGASLPAQR